ncbi:MAG TPA: M56 family metallopeptidase [Bryobacteraceae bacterium]|nr:M56 family metallopeptidase [Bryobacteraceae bacterium]
MNATLMVLNGAAYCLQAGALIAAGVGAIRLLRVERPLAFLQTLLLAVLLLPILQPWRADSEPAASRPAAAPAVASGAAPVEVPAPPPVDWARWTLWGLAAGMGLRAAWMGMGLWRLRMLRKYAVPLQPGVAVSTGIDGPVTFGFLRPIILVPPPVAAMPEAVRNAILAHERTHVRRRDWLFALWEEVVLCVFWFHPAVWFLVGQIRLTREQVVDAEACRLSDSRATYIDALLAVADARVQPYVAPAPPFLRRRQLAARIRSLVEEAGMSRFRLFTSYSAALLATAVAAVWMTASFPLHGAPQDPHAAPDGIAVSGATLVFSRPPTYPPAARRAGVSGPVQLEVTVAANGEATDARVLSGPQELRRAAIDAVLRWQFAPGPSTAQVTIEFRMPPETDGPRITAIVISDGIPATEAATLRARLELLIGQPLASDVQAEVQRVSPRLTTRLEQKVSDGVRTLTLFVDSPGFRAGQPIPPRIRIGAAVQAANILDKPEAEYPALARQARIQGTVRFDVIIDNTGAVISAQLVNGHPLLVNAALAAVQKYRYRLTQLNGQPVEVVTQVDVNFAL